MWGPPRRSPALRHRPRAQDEYALQVATAHRRRPGRGPLVGRDRAGDHQHGVKDKETGEVVEGNHHRQGRGTVPTPCSRACPRSSRSSAPYQHHCWDASQRAYAVGLRHHGCVGAREKCGRSDSGRYIGTAVAGTEPDVLASARCSRSRSCSSASASNGDLGCGNRTRRSWCRC